MKKVVIVESNRLLWSSPPRVFGSTISYPARPHDIWDFSMLRVTTFGTFQDATATPSGSLRIWKAGLLRDRLRGGQADLEGRAIKRVLAQVEVAESNSMGSPG